MIQKLTTSECRAEVACTVLYLMLRRLSPAEVERLQAEAMAEAKDIGRADILEEVDWLFSEAHR
ncbi:unnamed protein product [Phaeothamnion confervicola]